MFNATIPASSSNCTKIHTTNREFYMQVLGISRTTCKFYITVTISIRTFARILLSNRATMVASVTFPLTSINSAFVAMFSVCVSADTCFASLPPSAFFFYKPETMSLDDGACLASDDTQWWRHSSPSFLSFCQQVRTSARRLVGRFLERASPTSCSSGLKMKTNITWLHALASLFA